VRAELFNIFNHPNFALPGLSYPGVGPIGTISQTPDVRREIPDLAAAAASDSAGGEFTF
jgi:hypothetical protein